mmetsp:Transcript_102582/g.244534  ORF Transcript_102582/g.244534 Transcript_102582/m.244534 type:complete len:208 (-) Transcript_102582:371-994(-)
MSASSSASFPAASASVKVMFFSPAISSPTIWKVSGVWPAGHCQVHLCRPSASSSYCSSPAQSTGPHSSRLTAASPNCETPCARFRTAMAATLRTSFIRVVMSVLLAHSVRNSSRSMPSFSASSGKTCFIFCRHCCSLVSSVLPNLCPKSHRPNLSLALISLDLRISWKSAELNLEMSSTLVFSGASASIDCWPGSLICVCRRARRRL